MKIFDLSIIISVFCLKFNKAQNGEMTKLTKEENEERLKKCGNIDPPLPDLDIDEKAKEILLENEEWLRTVQRHESANEFSGTSTATMISSRHFITSSQVHLGSFKFEPSEICNRNGGLKQIDTDSLEKINLYIRDCNSEESDKACNDFPLNIRAAYIFPIDCTPDYTVFINNHFTPLIGEVENEKLDSFPCVADDRTKIENGEEVEAFSFDFSEKQMVHRHLQIKNTSTAFIGSTDKFYEPGDRGGPLLKKSDSKWTLIGIGADAAAQNSSNAFTLFHNMQLFHERICEIAGICQQTVPTTTTSEPLQTSSQSASYTVDSSTSNTSSIGFTTPPIFLMKTRKPKKPGVAYYDDFQEEKEDVQQNEFDGKLFVDQDFLNGKSIELCIWELFCITFLFWIL